MGFLKRTLISFVVCGIISLAFALIAPLFAGLPFDFFHWGSWWGFLFSWTFIGLVIHWFFIRKKKK